MIQKITEIFGEKERTFSLEFFPPKTEAGVLKLYEAARELNELGPDFVSVTYGAGGGTRGATLEICTELQERFGTSAMHHLTCVGHSREELGSILGRMKENNIRNVLALRGDPPKGVDRWEPAPDGFEYCYQLNGFIRSEYGDFFSIGVAGFPEGHIHCPDKETDSCHLRIKIEHGGDFVVTQLFFDNDIYTEYLERTKKEGVDVRILPGILPITSYEGLLRFCDLCGSTIPQKVHDIFKPLAQDETATREAGVEFAVSQCRDLLERGAPGLHFFTLNKVSPVREIWERLGL